MARPTLPPEERRTNRLAVNVSDAELEALTVAAGDVPLSRWIRESALHHVLTDAPRVVWRETPVEVEHRPSELWVRVNGETVHAQRSGGGWIIHDLPDDIANAVEEELTRRYP